LINQIAENRKKLSPQEYDLSCNILWKNLNKLSKDFDKQIISHGLSTSNKHCEDYSNYKRMMLKRKRKNNISGLTIVIEKKILQEQTIPQELTLSLQIDEDTKPIESLLEGNYLNSNDYLQVPILCKEDQKEVNSCIESHNLLNEEVGEQEAVITEIFIENIINDKEE
jgi:hypothetical protein